MSCARAHVTWVISLLIVLLIASLSFQLAEITQLADKIAVAANALSVVLALLAIIYAFISNSQLSKSLGSVTGTAAELNRATTDLKSTSDQIRRESEALPKLVDHLQAGFNERLTATVDSLKDASGKLANSVDRVTEVTSTVQAHAQTLPDLFKAFGGRLDAHMEETRQLIRERQAGQALSGGVQAEQSQPAIADDLVVKYLRRGSVTGLFFLVVLSEVHKRKLGRVNLNEVREATGASLDDDYIWGYAVASNAIGLLSVSHPDDDVFELRSAHPVILAETRDRFVEVAGKREKRKDRYSAWLTQLDSYLDGRVAAS